MSEFTTNGTFVLHDGVAPFPLGGGVMLIWGQILCAGNIVIDVEKQLDIWNVNGRARVQARAYSYNVSVSGVGNVFRYDSPHPDHNDFHHCHRVDWSRYDRPETVVRSYWPHLNQVIDEAHEWYVAQPQAA